MYWTVLLLLVTGVCTLTDLRDGRIYNAVLMPAVVVGLALRALPMAGGSWASLGEAFLRMGLMLALLMPFWMMLRGGIGGGDVKLYMVTAVMIEGRALLMLVFWSLLIAAMYGLLLRIRRGRGGRMRIGPAVLCAAIAYAGGVYG